MSLLHLPLDIRLLILEYVLSHEHRGYHIVGRESVPWTQLKLQASFNASPSETINVYLQEHEWPHAGLLLCNHQVAREAALVANRLRKDESCHETPRTLDLHKRFREGGVTEIYLTWEGPSWL